MSLALFYPLYVYVLSSPKAGIPNPWAVAHNQAAACLELGHPSGRWARAWTQLHLHEWQVFVCEARTNGAACERLLLIYNHLLSPRQSAKWERLETTDLRFKGHYIFLFFCPALPSFHCSHWSIVFFKSSFFIYLAPQPFSPCISSCLQPII